MPFLSQNYALLSTGEETATVTVMRVAVSLVLFQFKNNRCTKRPRHHACLTTTFNRFSSM